MIELYNESCLKTISLLEDNSIDLVLTSPPYNTSKNRGNWEKGKKNTRKHYDVESVDKMTDEEYINFTLDVFEGLERVLNKNGVVLYNISYSTEKPYLIYNVINAIMEHTNFVIADTIIWKKSSCLPNNMSVNRLSRICEFVFVFCRKSELKTFYMNKEVLSVRPTGQKQLTVHYNYIEAKNNDGTNKLNKATYSTDLCEQLLKMYAPEDCFVYDPFIGTGTTAVACERLGLHCVGSELSGAQVNFSVERLIKEFDYLADNEEGLYYEINEQAAV